MEQISSRYEPDLTAEEDASTATFDAAREARQWLDGEELEDGPDPVTGWRPLAR